MIWANSPDMSEFQLSTENQSFFTPRRAPTDHLFMGILLKKYQLASVNR